jgi:hypothetical protein
MARTSRSITPWSSRRVGRAGCWGLGARRARPQLVAAHAELLDQGSGDVGGALEVGRGADGEVLAEELLASRPPKSTAMLSRSCPRVTTWRWRGIGVAHEAQRAGEVAADGDALDGGERGESSATTACPHSWVATTSSSAAVSSGARGTWSSPLELGDPGGCAIELVAQPVAARERQMACRWSPEYGWWCPRRSRRCA